MISFWSHVKQTSLRTLVSPSLKLSVEFTTVSVSGILQCSYWQIHSLGNLVMCLCSMLATKLNMSGEDAEKWIVNLIRNAKLDAKIDAKEVYKCFREGGREGE